MPTYRPNLIDKGQNERESATFEGGIPIFKNGKTRVVAKGLHTAPQKTANAGSTFRNNAGVVMPHDDTPSRFVEMTQGKS